MSESSDQKWRELTAHYAGMYDEELLALAEDYKDLTEMAQQVLRDEMRKRKLGDPTAPSTMRAEPHPAAQFESPVPLSPEREDGEQLPDQSEYTWKAFLCECEDRVQGWQIQETLRRAGIESWIEGAGSRDPWALSSPRLQVAADQLEQAQQVIAQPIPADIVEMSTMEVPEFEMPKCPQCRSEEIVLESAEPTNSWLCEDCGAQWTDPAPDVQEN
jgi:hypothetical protein